MFTEPNEWNIADFRQDCLAKAKEVENPTNRNIISQLIDAGFILLENADENFAAEAEAIFSLSGYEYAYMNSPGVPNMIKRMMSVFGP